jgi:hypothetical protein
MIWTILIYLAVAIVGFVLGCVALWFLLMAAFEDCFKRKR